MKLFTLVFLVILYTNSSFSQIEKSSFFKDIVNSTETNFIKQQKASLNQELLVDSKQFYNLLLPIKNLHRNINLIHRNHISNHINTQRRNVEWNYELHNYYLKIESILNKEQINSFQNFYPKRKRKKAMRYFKITRLDKSCDIHPNH